MAVFKKGQARGARFGRNPGQKAAREEGANYFSFLKEK